MYSTKMTTLEWQCDNIKYVVFRISERLGNLSCRSNIESRNMLDRTTRSRIYSYTSCHWVNQIELCIILWIYNVFNSSGAQLLSSLSSVNTVSIRISLHKPLNWPLTMQHLTNKFKTNSDHIITQFKRLPRIKVVCCHCEAI